MTQSPTDRPLFEPVRTVRSSERVEEAIRQTILDGRIPAGETLPPERDLAQRFAVTRNTVREALRRLEQMRLVSVRQGSGITVRDYLTSAGFELAAALLGSGGEGAEEVWRDVAEVRMVVGEAMIRLAVRRFDLDHLPAVEEAVEAFATEARRPSPSVPRLQELDFEVHSRLLHGAGNRVLLLLHNSVRHVYERVAHLFEPLMADPQAVVAWYRAAVAALRDDRRHAAAAAFSSYFAAGTRNLVERAPRAGDEP